MTIIHKSYTIPIDFHIMSAAKTDTKKTFLQKKTGAVYSN